METSSVKAGGVRDPVLRAVRCEARPTGSMLVVGETVPIVRSLALRCARPVPGIAGGPDEWRYAVRRASRRAAARGGVLLRRGLQSLGRGHAGGARDHPGDPARG